MYLVTREQFADIQGQEGMQKDWYNEICELGECEGYTIMTFSNKSKRTACMPSDKYIDVVKSGIRETYTDMSDVEIMRYLVGCGVEYGN